MSPTYFPLAFLKSILLKKQTIISILSVRDSTMATCPNHALISRITGHKGPLSQSWAPPPGDESMYESVCVCGKGGEREQEGENDWVKSRGRCCETCEV